MLDDATNQSKGAQVAAAAADAVSVRLREQLERLRTAVRRAASTDTAAVSSGPPAGDPIGVLANVLERADRRAGILAEYADRARIAGLACERSYDALILQSKP
ncbi:DUF2514 family protein [Variovorax sp. J31P207]|uniref:DUF2514 family protein n=1 Tax=Variovorax sp. J31P207 TaxID=3053510 RepID=UPI00336539D4